MKAEEWKETMAKISMLEESYGIQKSDFREMAITEEEGRQELEVKIKAMEKVTETVQKELI